MEQQSLLSEIEFNPVFASVGKRFLNYLIDLIVFYILIAFILIILFTNNRITYNDYVLDNSGSHQLLVLVIEIFLLFLLYSLSEIIFKGHTIGKFITGTKVVNEDGSVPTTKTYFSRTLCRFVPFEPFSAFGGHPWHDKWTKTYVIDVRKTALNNFSAELN